MAQSAAHLAEPESDRALTPLQAPACTYCIALGPRAGQKVLSLQTVPSRAADSQQPGCVNAHGFSLHAGGAVPAHQRQALERLYRCITRPAIANARLKRNRAGGKTAPIWGASEDQWPGTCPQFLKY